jgi:hypothetical protein
MVTSLKDPSDLVGESTDNVLHKLGGSTYILNVWLTLDAHLNERGKKYAKALAKFIDGYILNKLSNEQRKE